MNPGETLRLKVINTLRREVGLPEETTLPARPAPLGYTTTSEFVSSSDDVAAIKAYAERHGLSISQACTRMDDPVLAEIDEIKYFAKTKGISLAEAFIVKGYQ